MRGCLCVCAYIRLFEFLFGLMSRKIHLFFPQQFVKLLGSLGSLALAWQPF